MPGSSGPIYQTRQQQVKAERQRQAAKRLMAICSPETDIKPLSGGHSNSSGHINISHKYGSTGNKVNIVNILFLFLLNSH